MLDRRRLSIPSNAGLTELLACQSECEAGILAQAYRRAARSAFLWPENAAKLVAQNRSLAELRGIGPFIGKQVRQWIGKPHVSLTPPPIRRDFLALSEARELLNKYPTWSTLLRGDLQMHTRWSDGSGTVAQMAEAARKRGYDYIAITDHSKGLKIAGGIDEAQLRKQAAEIMKTNAAISRGGEKLIVLS